MSNPTETVLNTMKMLRESGYVTRKTAQNMEAIEDEVRTNKHLTDYERGWLEALIDSEGCIYFNVGNFQERYLRWRATVQVGNKNRELLEKALRIVGSGSLNSYNPKGNRNYAWQLTWHAATVRVLLPQLDLIVKREQKRLILVALEILEERRKTGSTQYTDDIQARLITIAEEFRKLNFRGRKSKLGEFAQIRSVKDG